MSKSEDMQNPFAILSERLDRIESLLQFIIANQQSIQHSDKGRQCDTGIELAIRITGYERKTIYNLAYKRMIPHSKRRGKLFFDEKELKEWIKQGKRQTLDELNLIK
jgi:predicted DNA-binding transcriptional regulator AlpA